jgi:hypothetical protein
MMCPGFFSSAATEPVEVETTAPELISGHKETVEVPVAAGGIGQDGN